MFKDGISVPGLTLKFMFNALPPDANFFLFNEKNKDLYDTLNNGLTGGPSINFYKHHETGITNIRQSKLGKAARSYEAIVGYDANALFLVQEMPTEANMRRSEVFCC